MMAPEDFVGEEERLREEREAAFAAEAAEVSCTQLTTTRHARSTLADAAHGPWSSCMTSSTLTCASLIPWSRRPPSMRRPF